MKNRKLIAATAALFTAAAGLNACSPADAAHSDGVVSLRYQGWTDQVTLPELAQALGYFDGKVKLNWVGNTISGPQDIQAAATGRPISAARSPARWPSSSPPAPRSLPS